jgi:hypothetical protein
MPFLWRETLRRGGYAVVALTLTSLAVAPAQAQETFDPSKLATTPATPGGAKTKTKKSGQQPQPTTGQQPRSGKAGGDRQFGELEGWTPGHAAPAGQGGKSEEKSTDGGAPMSLSPSGQPSMGFRF